MRQDTEIFQRLVERVGETHLRLRLNVQIERAALVFGQGRTLFHIENVEWLMVVLYHGLRLSGLYRLGRRGAGDLRVRHNEVRIDRLPPPFDGMRLLHLSDLHLDLDAGHLDVVVDRVRGLEPGEPAILLAHSPEIFRQAAACGYDLMLCGHTHGGQICLPGGVPLLTNARCPRALRAGPWRHQMMHGYTSAGTGSCGVPVRYFCPPEVTLHTLRPGP